MKDKILKILYSLFLRYNYTYRYLTNSFDSEMKLIPELVNHNRRAIDIGANIGIYSRYLSNIFEQVEAFEPLMEASKYLKNANLKNVTVYNIALSDYKGNVDFNIPVKKGVERYGNSSIENSISNKFDEVKHINVRTEKLDNYKFENIDFIKIDVEGHEMQVLKGAQKTIQKNKPVIQIEIETRHLPEKIKIKDIFHWFNNCGYEGYFFKDNELNSIEKFNEEYQNKYLDKNNSIKLSNKLKSKLYVNNFFMVPDEI